MKKSAAVCACIAVIVALTAGAARAADPPRPVLDVCAGGTCSARHCSACCAAGTNPTCSWWACKCRPAELPAALVGPGSILDP